MNAGRDRDRARRQALANAREHNRPFYVWHWGDSYWVDRDPPTNTQAGVYPENVDVVHPEGHMETYADVRARLTRPPPSED